MNVYSIKVEKTVIRKLDRLRTHILKTIGIFFTVKLEYNSINAQKKEITTRFEILEQ